MTLGAALLATAGAAQRQPLDSGGVMQAVEKLQPGQYIWVPEIAPQGPMLVIVNIATQRLVAYRNGVPIGVSTVSTGRPGHRTPQGVFTVLQKAVHHRSSKYSNAPMPYMQRLTWSGIAMHGGNLPGYPASHGCIRLPHDFAPLLFGETDLGMTVIVLNQPAQLRLAPTPQTVNAGYRPGSQAPTMWRPELSPTGPVSIVVSAADRRMIVLRNGVEIGSAPVQFDGVVDRVQAYVLQGVVGGEYRWRKVPLPGQPAMAEVPDADGGNRFQQRGDLFQQALATVIGPGTTLVVIPDSLGAFSAPREQLAVLEPEAEVPGWMGDASVTSGR
ncbi:L,D-transpeptidase family protein [Sphingomonas sp. LB-2]|uniref:L,D-transpeptidase family protein n=1 Tax=Sphingomonas caeni TaxID=2984949 RepID=UPI00223015AF|nr:L,D-transpeptidase family protein [Sphingomonas caeni]MCW3847125.1 L,D-transpeptidase family protein [Sphingomonas caeni]